MHFTRLIMEKEAPQQNKRPDSDPGTGTQAAESGYKDRMKLLRISLAGLPACAIPAAAQDPGPASRQKLPGKRQEKCACNPRLHDHDSRFPEE